MRFEVAGFTPPPDQRWQGGEDFIKGLHASGHLEFRDGIPFRRYFADEESDENRPFYSFVERSDSGTSEAGKNQLNQVMGNQHGFDTVKPVEIVSYLLDYLSFSDSLILDSFAGSGTAAHAVLKANARDNGQRKFILVEGEDYADRLTAERVRRAIKGYAWSGTQREELLKEKITFTQFKKADEWLKKVEAIKAREGFAEGDLADQGTTKKRRFEKIEAKLDDGVLLVEGVKRISQMVDGLGGEFTYCTLGEPLDIEKLLAGENLPGFDALGAWLFHTATGGTLPPTPKKAPPWYLGEAKDAHVWLIYEPTLSFLKSPEAALTLTKAREFAAWGKMKNDGKRHLVFAPAKYMSNKQLAEHGVDYAPLPFALYREG
jgi:adenine-specific DNA-methyltransferase